MKPAQNAHDISRRSFIKVLAVETSALALTGCGLSRAIQETTADLPTKTTQILETTLPSISPTLQPTETLTTLPDETDFLPPVSQVGEIVPLPPPNLSNSAPLMTALSQRHSTRTCLPEDLPLSTLSDLLWAGFGVNRPESGGRTAPSAYDMQDMHIFVADEGGLWLYDAPVHSLVSTLTDDLRSLTSPPANAPVQLIYVSRHPAGYSAQDMLQFSWAHTGFIAQNVYLYCAAAGLATVVRSSFDHDRLAERMGLKENEHITLVQAVGKESGVPS